MPSSRGTRPQVVFAVILLLAVALPAAHAALIRTLVLSGANNHDWQQTTPVLVKILQDTGRFRVQVTDDPSALTTERLAPFDLVVSNWTNFPNEERIWGNAAEQAVLDFVRQGKGFAVFHAGAAVFPDWPEYLEMLGSHWDLGQTGHGAIHTFGVTMADRQHVITQGLADFRLQDELWHSIAVDPGARILATAFSDAEQGGTGQDEPVALITHPGKGRCFNLVLGHDTTAMLNEGWRLLFVRGAEWAATGAVTITSPVGLDVALRDLRSFDGQGSRDRLEALALMVHRSSEDPALRSVLVPELLTILDSEAPVPAKAVVLNHLGLVGGDDEVPPIASLLGDPDLGVHALFALERIPGDAAKAAIDDLAGGNAGAASLSDAGVSADALLLNAEALAERGEVDSAIEIYRTLAQPGPPEHVRAAAFMGLLRRVALDERVRLARDALAGGPGSAADALLRYLHASRDAELGAALLPRWTRVDDSMQAPLVVALLACDTEGAGEAILEACADDELRARVRPALLSQGVLLGVTRSAVLIDPGPNLALDGVATSPDDHDKDGASHGDQAAIDGDPETYWDEVDDQALYRLLITFPSSRTVSALRITGHTHHGYAPRDFTVRCDGEVIATVQDAWYESNRFAMLLPTTDCTTLELEITGYYGLSPAIRELEVFGPVIR